MLTHSFYKESSTPTSSELNLSLLKPVYLTRLCPIVILSDMKYTFKYEFVDLLFVMAESVFNISGY